MVEFPVELSLITLSKPKTRGENVGLRLNLTLKFGAKKVQLVHDCIRYPLEFVLILFEDSGFLINVKYSLLLSSYRLTSAKTNQAISVNPMHNFPQMLSRVYVEIAIHNSCNKDHTEPGTQKRGFLVSKTMVKREGVKTAHIIISVTLKIIYVVSNINALIS